jgi:hypothetical protein
MERCRFWAFLRVAMSHEGGRDMPKLPRERCDEKGENLAEIPAVE